MLPLRGFSELLRRRFAPSPFPQLSTSPFRLFAPSPFPYLSTSPLRRFAPSPFPYLSTSPFRRFAPSPFPSLSRPISPLLFFPSLRPDSLQKAEIRLFKNRLDSNGIIRWLFSREKPQFDIVTIPHMMHDPVFGRECIKIACRNRVLPN